MSQYQESLPMFSRHTQVSYVTCQNKSSLSHILLTCVPSENIPRHLFFGCIIPTITPQLLPIPSYLSPTPWSISLKIACSKILKSVNCVFQSSCLKLSPFPHSWCHHYSFSALKLPIVFHQNLLLEKTHIYHLYFGMTVLYLRHLGLKTNEKSSLGAPIRTFQLLMTEIILSKGEFLKVWSEDWELESLVHWLSM